MAKKQTKKTTRKSTKKKKVDFHYLKTSSYRSFRVDGAFGGLTPKGEIYLELYLERQVTPKIVTHEINKNGQLGKELKREGKRGMIREVECGISLDIVTAQTIRDFLDKQINDFKDKIIKKG